MYQTHQVNLQQLERRRTKLAELLLCISRAGFQAGHGKREKIAIEPDT